MTTLQDHVRRGYGFSIVYPQNTYRLSISGRNYVLTCYIESTYPLNWDRLEETLAQCADILDRSINPGRET